jgi:hypothetical protein
MASIAMLLAESGDMPNIRQILETKVLVSSATAINMIGRQMLYPLTPATLLTLFSETTVLKFYEPLVAIIA